jgi:hypothetical protein
MRSAIISLLALMGATVVAAQQNVPEQFRKDDPKKPLVLSQTYMIS